MSAARSSALPGQRPPVYDGPSWAPPRPTAPDAPGGPGGGSGTGGGAAGPAPGPLAPPVLGRSRRLWSLLPLAGLLAAAGLGFHRVHGTDALVPVLLVALPAPMALSVGLFLAQSRKGRTAPLWPSLLLGAAVWMLTVCGTLFRAQGDGLPTGGAVRAASSALLDSPHAVLTTILPAPATGDFLVLPHAVVWLASMAATELALRTRGPLLPAVPPVLAFGFPLVLGVDGPGSNLPLAVALAVCGALLVLLRSPAARRGTVRALGMGLPVVAVLTLAAALLGPRLPGLSAQEPYDPRKDVKPPTVRPQSVSPLDQVPAWLQHPETELFTVRARAEHNWRLAVLDRYDGVKWTSSAELTRSGGRVPPERGADPGRRRQVEQRVTVQKLSGIWLPAADRPTDVRTPRGKHLAVDPVSGILATGAGAPTGARVNSGLTYTAQSSVPVYDVKRLQYAATPTGQAYKSLPRTDAAGKPIAALETFSKLAATATKGSSYPYQQAYRLAGWLREHYRYDPRSVPGHAYRNLEFFLTTGKHGTSEQFAAAFAVMARSLGLPTRVAVGFRAGSDTGGAGATTRQVTGRDALAWPEVRFKGIGWVPFYPTPGQASKDNSSVPPAGQPKERDKADREVAEQPPPSLPPKDKKDAKDDSRGGAGSADDAGLPAWAYVPLTVLLLSAAYCGYAAWAPYRTRRNRRNARDAGRRVLGAWQQIVDRLTEIGLPATSAHTATEVAAFGTERIGGATSGQLPALAGLVNEVEYAGRAPDSAAADAAWQHCDAVEAVVARSVPLRVRVGRALHPRTVLRHLRPGTRDGQAARTRDHQTRAPQSGAQK